MVDSLPTPEKVFSTACALPYCKVDRQRFLDRELRDRVAPAQLANALDNGTIRAAVPLSVLDSIANGAIAFETSKVTLISTATGIPGGLAMLGTVPADLAQYYAHVLRIAQKLAYVYGSKDMDLADGTRNELMLYLGVMFGVGTANAAVTKLALANAPTIAHRLVSKPLTKYTTYNISKKVLAWIGVKLTKDTVGRAVTKAIPVVSGVLSGGLTVATYLPMAKRLQRHLSGLAAMSPEALADAVMSADIVLADVLVTEAPPVAEDDES